MSDMPPCPGCALIVTAIPVEYAEVRRHLRDVREEVLPHGLVTETGELDTPGGVWHVWILEAGMGNENAALETDRAVSTLRPEAVLFVGVAGGRKDVEIGDVVVANKVYGYESGKDEESFRPRPESLEPTYRILQRARAVARSGTWRERLSLTEGDRTPEVRVKPIAAGEKVVGSRVSAVARLLDATYNDTAAVDMEGHGFLRAMHARPGVEALVVRGVSDLFEGKAASDAAGGQLLAVRHAVAFALEVLSSSREVINSADTDPERLSDTFWTQLWNVASTLYSRGPEEEAIWDRAGGELNRLRLNQSPRGIWYEAIQQLRRGASSKLSLGSLLRAMQHDFPDAEDLKALIRSAAV